MVIYPYNFKVSCTVWICILCVTLNVRKRFGGLVGLARQTATHIEDRIVVHVIRQLEIICDITYTDLIG